ncbi:MAG: Sua5 family C-terminal domain-containing protein, partial [Planctomycetota bacterium]|nr:Sua5 family C-terminal domain-containing protein [Planctomycetota bacterium]
DERVGWIRFHVDTSAEGPEASIVRILSNHGDLTEIARSLFATLRELDQLDLDLIVIDTCEEQGMGRAIMDRIRRASARSDV